MAGHAELGKTFLQELAAKLPDSLKGNLDAILSSPEAQAALEVAGSRVSPIDEERQRLNALKTQLDTRDQKLTDWHGRLGSWASTKEAELTDRERKLTERENGNGGGNGNGNGGPPNNGGAPAKATVDKAELANTISEFVQPREAAFVQYVADATNFSAFHLKNFNEALDVGAIVRHPDIGKIGFAGVYQQLNKEKLDKMQADAKLAERNAIKDEVRKELIGERPVDMPYPIAEGSPLDVLAMDADKRPKGDPVAATRMYEQLVASSGSR